LNLPISKAQLYLNIKPGIIPGDSSIPFLIVWLD
jgi:hypothetical protein